MTGGGPVATQDHAFVLGCKGIGELLACRTKVNVLISHIAEVLLTEASFRLCVRGHRLWQRNRDASLLGFRTIQVYLKDLRALPGHAEPALSWHSGFRGGAHARPK